MRKRVKADCTRVGSEASVAGVCEYSELRVLLKGEDLVTGQQQLCLCSVNGTEQSR